MTTTQPGIAGTPENARNQHFPPGNGQKECLSGGHFFTPARPWQKWCSKKCRDDHRNRERWDALRRLSTILLEAEMLIQVLTPKGRTSSRDAG